MVRKQGVKGLFQGMGSVLLREVPQFAVYYPWYEYARRKGLEQGYFSPLIVQALAGGTAGVVQWLPPFYFFDVIKSRMQTSPVGQYKSIFHCANTLYKEEGLSVFFRYSTPLLFHNNTYQVNVMAPHTHTVILVYVHLTLAPPLPPLHTYRGLSPALLRAFPLHALIFVFYEVTILQLKSS